MEESDLALHVLDPTTSQIFVGSIANGGLFAVVLEKPQRHFCDLLAKINLPWTFFARAFTILIERRACKLGLSPPICYGSVG
jgi:hypothetical protein